MIHILTVWIMTFSLKTIGAVIVLVCLYFIAFSKDTSLLNSAGRERLEQLKKLTGGRISGRYSNALIGLLFVLLSFLMAYLLYKS